MSYGAIWPRMPAIVKGCATEQFITNEFSFYEAGWI